MAKENGIFIEHFVPIESSAEIDGDFTIHGIAINETTTTNGHKFIGEELSLSAHTLIGVPLLKDHNNSVDSIVGKVISANYNESSRNIPFKAVVKDLKMKQLIKDGLLNTVSVGAHVDPSNIEELGNGDIVPHGITFKELSLVACPADPAATFRVALNNAYNKYKSHSNENLISIEREEDKMTEQEKPSEETTKVVTDENVTEKILAKLNSIEKSMEERFAKLESSDEDEVQPAKEEESKEDTEEEAEEETEEKVEEKGNYKFTQSYNSFGIERKSYNY